MSGAQEYAQVTGLSKRVHEWEDKIMPKLKQEVCRNIHYYRIEDVFITFKHGGWTFE